MPVVIRPAVARDLAPMEALMLSVALPTAGIARHLSEFLVAEHGDAIVAAAGLERYGSSALLRSVAVQPAYRGRGLAQLLVRHLLDRARAGGIGRVYLLTTTAAGYFARLGFGPIIRDAVDAGVRASEEFTDACCDSAQVMALALTTREGGTRYHEPS